MRRKLLPVWAIALLLAGCQAAGEAPFPTELEQFGSAGDATVFDETSTAYSLPLPSLNLEEIQRHGAGDLAFEAQFVSAPAPVNPGLGPVFNNVSCIACHKGDGGGRPPEEGGASMSMLFRLSVPGETAEGGPAPAPGFGGQLQDRALFGVAPEARVTTRYASVTGSFADGAPYTLRRPTHTLSEPYRPLPEDLMISARLSSPVFGLGLLEAVPEARILARADAEDQDGDGISGRANLVWDVEAKAARLGRFGWKAGAPSLRQQVAGAYHQDMGLTSPVFPEEAAKGQPQAPAGGDATPELSEATLASVTYYVQTLAVPGRRHVGDPEVRRGAALFGSLKCASCHVPTLTTGASPAIPALAFQVIHPYTDLLLHDMGEGLADHRPDFLASGSEWRTPPLWGIGLRQRVQGHARMLHDGRADGAEEAILWHGGEAEASKQAYLKLSRAERQAIQAFLSSL